MHILYGPDSVFNDQLKVIYKLSTTLCKESISCIQSNSLSNLYASYLSCANQSANLNRKYTNGKHPYQRLIPLANDDPVQLVHFISYSTESFIGQLYHECLSTVSNDYRSMQEQLKQVKAYNHFLIAPLLPPPWCMTEKSIVKQSYQFITRKQHFMVIVSCLPTLFIMTYLWSLAYAEHSIAKPNCRTPICIIMTIMQFTKPNWCLTLDGMLWASNISTMGLC